MSKMFMLSILISVIVRLFVRSFVRLFVRQDFTILPPLSLYVTILPHSVGSKIGGEEGRRGGGLKKLMLAVWSL